MVRRAAFVLVWVLATMVATGVGLAAVRGVAGEVVDSPSSELLSLPTPTAEPVETDVLEEPGSQDLQSLAIGEADSFAATSTTEVPVVASPEPTETSETPLETSPPSTTTPPAAGGETAATQPTPPPTTTTAPTTPPPSDMGETTYRMAGGWVRLTHDDGIVTLDAAGPSSGFTMVINGNGPDRVNIAFRSSDHLSRLRAEWRGGELEVEVVEEPRGR